MEPTRRLFRAPALESVVSQTLIPASGSRAGRRLLLAGVSLALTLTLSGFSGKGTLQGMQKKPPATKSIRGHVGGPDGKSLPGAKVFVKNLENDTTTILVTDEKGLYSVYGLDPDLDYEVHAEHQRLSSKALAVSSMLRRYDNVLNFTLSDRGERNDRSGLSVLKESIEIPGQEGARFVGDWYPPPQSGEGRFPAVLLLPGSQEKRDVWNSFIEKKLLGYRMGVLNTDLTGHGVETSGGEGSPSELDSDDIRTLQDLVESALGWLQARESIDPFRIAVVGAELGADLAFLASGKFENVRSAVVISGNLPRAHRMADKIRDFQPLSLIHI